MDKTVNIHTAKTTLSKLIAEVEAGEEIVIARAGKPVARLVAARKKKATAKPKFDRKPGFMKGKIWMSPDFDDPLPANMLAAMLGDDD
jgi:prevent-host-death family protein